MVWIIGKVHNEPQVSSGVRGPEILADEITEFCASLKDKPVCLNHDQSLVIGKVLKVWQSTAEFGRVLLAFLHVDHKLPLFKPYLSKLFRAEFNGLSISQLYFTSGNGVRTSKSFGVEISLVNEGAVQNSRIFAFGFGAHSYLSQSGLKRIMTEVSEKELEASKTMDDIEQLRADSLELKKLKKLQDDAIEKKLKADFLDLSKNAPGLIPKDDLDELVSAIKHAEETSTVGQAGRFIHVAASMASNHANEVAKFQQTTAAMQSENEQLKKQLSGGDYSEPSGARVRIVDNVGDSQQPRGRKSLREFFDGRDQVQSSGLVDSIMEEVKF